MPPFKLARDPYYEQILKERLWRGGLFRRDPHIHRGDLIYCLRKGYFRLMGIEPPELPFIEFSVIGKTLHRIIERSFKYTEEEVEKDGILGTIDIITPIAGKIFPIEIKTTRKRIYSARDIPHVYLEQLKMAIIMRGTDEGLLAILNVITAELQVWVLRLSPEEKKTFWDEILRRKKLLEKAIKLKNPLLLPRTRWMCRKCEYAPLCDKLEASGGVNKGTHVPTQ